MNTPLISNNELAALHQKVLARKTRRAIATTYVPGQHTSRYRGHGVELNDNRPYQNGDDIRHMDWRATARSGKAIMKVFQEERQRSLYLILDKTSTMRFGTRTTLKANCAARAAAIFTLATLSQHEPAAGLVIGAQGTYFPASRAINKAFDLINAIVAPMDDTATPLWHKPDINKLLIQSKRQTPHGSTVIIISDFVGFDKTHHALINQLSQQRQLIAIHVSDPAEESIPDIGQVPLRSPVSGKQHLVDTRDPNVRLAFEKNMQQRQLALRHFFSACNAPLYKLHTQHDVFAQLEQLW